MAGENQQQEQRLVVQAIPAMKQQRQQEGRSMSASASDSAYTLRHSTAGDSSSSDFDYSDSFFCCSSPDSTPFEPPVIYMVTPPDSPNGDDTVQHPRSAASAAVDFGMGSKRARVLDGGPEEEEGEEDTAVLKRSRAPGEDNVDNYVAVFDCKESCLGVGKTVIPEECVPNADAIDDSHGAERHCGNAHFRGGSVLDTTGEKDAEVMSYGRIEKDGENRGKEVGKDGGTVCKDGEKVEWNGDEDGKINSIRRMRNDAEKSACIEVGKDGKMVCNDGKEVEQLQEVGKNGKTVCKDGKKVEWDGDKDAKLDSVGRTGKDVEETACKEVGKDGKMVCKDGKNNGDEEEDTKLLSAGRIGNDGEAARKDGEKVEPNGGARKGKNVAECSRNGDKVKKQSGLMGMLDVLKVIVRSLDKEAGKEDEEEDFLEVAKRRGVVFPRPRWWPPEGEDF